MCPRGKSATSGAYSAERLPIDAHLPRHRAGTVPFETLSGQSAYVQLNRPAFDAMSDFRSPSSLGTKRSNFLAWPVHGHPSFSPKPQELFPLPRIERTFPGVTGSRSSRRKAARRQDVLDEANFAVDSLNSLYGVVTPDAAVVPTAAQSSSHHHILDCIASARPSHVPSPREAIGKLLGSPHPEYLGDGSTVEPYDAERVSMPRLGAKAIPVELLLDPHAKDSLRAEILLEDDAVRLEADINDPVRIYMDERLKRDQPRTC